MTAANGNANGGAAGNGPGPGLRSVPGVDLAGSVPVFGSRPSSGLIDGESFAEAQHRSVESVERIAGAHEGKTVVAVSHSDVIKLIIAHYLGQALDLFQRLRISTASVSELQIEGAHSPAVVSVNGRGAVT